MRILNLNDWRVKQVRNAHPALLKSKVLGSGVFATAFDDGDPATVLKLTTDRYSYAYLTDGCYSPSKDHAPRVYEDFGQVGETSRNDPLFLVRVERLQPLENGTVSKKFARKVAKLSNMADCFTAEALDKLEMPTSLRKFFEQLECFFLNMGGSPDLGNLANVMQRHDGTLVLNDPVCDKMRLYTMYTERRNSRSYRY